MKAVESAAQHEAQWGTRFDTLPIRKVCYSSRICSRHGRLWSFEAMLIAEIRRKLIDLEDIDPEGEDVIEQVRALLSTAKEDLLTADMFGALCYLPADFFLRSVLDAIARTNSKCVALQDQNRSLGSDDQFSFRFWPTYRNPPGLSGQKTQPDVELTSRRTRLFFEVKLGSGFGELQIPRQLLIGLTQDDRKEFCLVLVTNGLVPPRIKWKDRRLEVDDYVEAVATCRDVDLLNLSDVQRQLLSEGVSRIAWISWRRLAVAIEQASVLWGLSGCCGRTHGRAVMNLVDDLRTLLKMRGIAPFDGIGRKEDDRSRVPMPVGRLLPVRTRTFGGFVSVHRSDVAHVASWPKFSVGLAAGRIGVRGYARNPFSSLDEFRPVSLPERWLAGRSGKRRLGLRALFAPLPVAEPVHLRLPVRSRSTSRGGTENG